LKMFAIKSAEFRNRPRKNRETRNSIRWAMELDDPKDLQCEIRETADATKTSDQSCFAFAQDGSNMLKMSSGPSRLSGP